MLQNRRFIIILCIVLAVVLAGLLVCETLYPEAGSELIRGIRG